MKSGRLDNSYTKFAGISAALSFAALLEISGRKPLEGWSFAAFTAFLLSGLCMGFYSGVPSYLVDEETGYFARIRSCAFSAGCGLFIVGASCLMASVSHKLAIAANAVMLVLFLSFFYDTHRLSKSKSDLEEGLKAGAPPASADSSGAPPANAG